MTSPQQLLKAWQLKAQKRLGQHFLADPAIALSIVRHSGITTDDVVLEVGAGLGALTIPLAAAAKKVYAVEKDRNLLALLHTELLLHRIDNVALLRKDIFQVPLPEIAASAGGQLVVMGNLPYYISSQLLVHLVNHRHLVNRATLMFQKELAERLMASPGSKAYGRLAVMLAYCAKSTLLREVSAACFYPKPKIDSSVLLIRFTDKPACRAKSEAFFFRTVKAAFGRRRKTLKNALAGSELCLAAGQASVALQTANIDATRRAETLTVEEFVHLSDILYQILNAQNTGQEDKSSEAYLNENGW